MHRAKDTKYGDSRSSGKHVCTLCSARRIFVPFAFRFRAERTKNMAKYTYLFADGEKQEVEVSYEILEILKKEDHDEYLNDRRETRRHIHWEAMDNDGETFVIPERFQMNSATAPEIWHGEMLSGIRESLEALDPDQRELIRKIFFEMKNPSEIAEAEGVGRSAISNRLTRIYKKIKKNLETDREF